MAILIIDNYDSFTFNLYQLVQMITPEPVIVRRNDAIDLAGVKELAPSKLILSPGPGSPDNPKDFGVCANVIVNQKALGCPILGVCLGHQGIVHHLGGRVATAPDIVHGKSSAITITHSSPLFGNIPKTFEAMRYHSLVALDKDLPEEIIVTARDKTHGLVMGIQHLNLPIYGLQFHPESIGTPFGPQIIRNFVEKC